MKTEYWVYAPVQYNPATPSALMIWQDGHHHVERDGPLQVATTDTPQAVCKT